MSRLHCDRLSKRHRKSDSEILKLDVGFHYPSPVGDATRTGSYPLTVYVLPNLRMIKFHPLFVVS
ncbi:MAG: hypothetical protein V7K21_02060 [Nostoc sp.]|uniref:hypothetical protein n=1 Tax=Nostoc sp. TaxID=1180 RepID=UPI002FF792CC